jgi:hypothetical protein
MYYGDDPEVGRPPEHHLTYALPEGFGPAPGQVAKVRVAGVWKGIVHRDTILYFREGEGDRPLEVGREYLVIASVLSAVGRQQFGLSAEGEDLTGVMALACFPPSTS